MGEPTVIPPGRGELVGDSPERRVEIVSDHDGFGAFQRALHDAGDEELAAARVAFDQQPAP